MKFLPSARVVASMLTGMAATLLAPALRGDAGAVIVRYRALPPCPGEAEFFAEVRQRNPRVAPVSATGEAQLLVTIVEGASPRFAGRLERTTPSGTAGVREIGGDSCGEVARALALITALTADWVGTSPAPPGEQSQNRPGVVGANPGVAPPTSPRADTGQEPMAAPATEAVANARWQAGVAGAVASGITQNPLIGGTLFAEVGARRSALWAPSARLSASLARSSWTSGTTTAEAQFVWAVASLDACPLRFGHPLGLSLEPCARVTAGLLRASGTGRISQGSENDAWVDTGGVLRGHWQVGRNLFFEAEGELFVAEILYSFQFHGPDETASETDRFGARFGIGMGVMFR